MSPTSVRSRFHLATLALALLATRGVACRPAWAGAAFNPETEPNNTSAAANPLGGTTALVKGNLMPGSDVDFFSFQAATGDRIYAATQTLFSSAAITGQQDTILELIGPDGTTVIEGDEDDGSFSGLASSLANVNIPAAGTYFLRVRPSTATVQVRPYFLHFRQRTGSPTAETEPNDTLPGQTLPASGWVSGDASGTADVDFYSVALNAGDTVYLSLDLDPERNGDGNMQLGFGVFDGFTLNVNDSGAGFAPYTAPDSEAFFMTVKAAGTYSIAVSVPAGGVPSTYTLNLSVYPAANEGVNCTTYTSTNVPVVIGDLTTTTSTITVPGNPRIADLDVILNGNHTFMADLDVHLISPAGNDNGLFTDVFGATIGGTAVNLDITLDDEAGSPPAFAVSAGMNVQPEAQYRLSWFDGENAGGVWTLAIRDDASGDTGNLTGWALRICEPAPAPACPPGQTPVTVFTTDFEGGASGFTHSGTADEWELGLPATAATTAANPVAAFTSCASGTSCWKTDLDNTYNASSTQDLLSAPVNLAGLNAPVVVRWSHRYQMDSATNDHYTVSAQPVGTPASAIRLFDFSDHVMTDAAGNPTANIGASAGWGQVVARADALAGQNTELVFHLDSGTGATNFGGAAIDDVSVTACQAVVVVADVAITKTDGVASAVPGQNVVYTIVASNSSGTGATGATVADTFPAGLTCNWTCVGSGGGTCTAAGAGNINDAVNLPNGSSVTYTATCAVSASATGSISNTATITLAGDPNGANNSATDTDTVTPQADVSVTKTDGVSAVTQGGSTTYTIVASNAGPSNAPGTTVTDTFPADLTCNWTCVGAGGGTCTAAGAGNISDSANLPAGGSATYTASCTVSGTAASPLNNTATVAVGAGITDGTPGNNSATDSDTVNPAAVPGSSVSGTKTVSGSFVVGGNIVYTITLNNAGPGAQPDNPTDEFTDVLPATLALVSASASSGTAFANTGTNTVTWNGAIAASGSVTITINATILPGAAGQSVNNQGTISYDADGNGSNEATAQTDDPGATGAANPTSFAVPGVAEDIPTLSTIGLLAMAAFLAVLALALLRRRQGSNA